ncbi:MAG TPA: ATP-binding protein [Kofleriaceae bacterium]|jgi:hypothetical protein|nr:ATP-binding protein [Kofleriaceae bacterium]
MSYTSAAAVFDDRVRWSAALLGELLYEARTSGWVEGTSTPPPASSTAARTLIRERLAATLIDVTVLPIEWLRIRLHLDEPQCDGLWLLICVELDFSLARVAQLFGSADCPDVNVHVWQRLVAISDSGVERLRRLGLIETSSDERVPRHRRRVRAADRVLELVRGELRLDPAVAHFAELVLPVIGDSTLSLPESSAFLIALGVEGAGRATLLRAAINATGRGTLEVRVAELSRDAERCRAELGAVAREARLFGVVPMLRELPVQAGDVTSAIERELLQSFDELVVATASASPVWTIRRPVVVENARSLTTTERAQIWRSVLDADADIISAVSERYAITPGAIVATARNTRARCGASGDPITTSDIHTGLRAHLGQRLGTLAKLVEWQQRWDDLVLPAAQIEQVEELCARVRFRRDVLETQGFGKKTAKGNGIVALLSGDPGTGKTMVAGLIANELGLDLYQVDLSVVVSKYIGETEKGLARLFDAAESGHIILLFDEADALFAKRSEVTSSNDRYANLETNYLLQRLEAFGGITLLTTNHETALDDAFRRRIAVHVKFPLPDESERAELWRAMIPEEARVEEMLDVRALARDYDMSGGHIKNAVIRAAFLAAARGVSIDDTHLRAAAHAEFEAMGRISSESL